MSRGRLRPRRAARPHRPARAARRALRPGDRRWAGPLVGGAPSPTTTTSIRRSPSSTDRRGIERWRCWSGGHGGTAIDAIHVAFRIGYREAIEELARRAGLQPDEPGVRRIRRPLPPRQPVPLHPQRGPLRRGLRAAAVAADGRPVLDYLIDERGLDPDVLRANRVGADPGTASSAAPADSPRHGPGAVFPALDRDGAVAYFQTRYLDPGRAPIEVRQPGQPARRQPAPRLDPTRRRTRSSRSSSAKAFPTPTPPTAPATPPSPSSAPPTPPRPRRTSSRRAIGDRPVILAFDGDDARPDTPRSISPQRFGARGIMVVEIPLPSGTDFNSWVHTARHGPGTRPAMRPTPTPGIAAAPRRRSPDREGGSDDDRRTARPTGSPTSSEATETGLGRDHRHRTRDPRPTAVHPRRPGRPRRRRRLPRRPPAPAGRVRRRRHALARRRQEHQMVTISTSTSTRRSPISTPTRRHCSSSVTDRDGRRRQRRRPPRHPRRSTAASRMPTTTPSPCRQAILAVLERDWPSYIGGRVASTSARVTGGRALSRSRRSVAARSALDDVRERVGQLRQNGDDLRPAPWPARRTFEQLADVTLAATEPSH